jgi:DNA-directed RNA polymerase subunit N
MVKRGLRDKNLTGERRMIIPVRCFSCGKPIGHLWEPYQDKIKTESKKAALDSLGIERMCCRGAFLGHVDLLETVAQFKKN